MHAILSVCFAVTVVAASDQEYGMRAWQRRMEAGVLGERIDPQSVDKSDWANKDAQAAISTAQRVLGVPADSCKATAELVKVDFDNTPFLVSKLERKTFWQVTVYDWKLDSPSAPTRERENSRTRTFDVLVRPEDGRVVKVRSRWPEGEPMMAPEFGAGDATCHTFGGGWTIYHDFPDKDPQISLLDALVVLYHAGCGGQPLTAKQILAIPVVWSNVGHETPRPVWVINLRGVFPGWAIEENPEPKHEWRYIVDAETGKVLIAGNVPQSDEDTAGRASKAGE
jgi:hypothetical protein